MVGQQAVVADSSSIVVMSQVIAEIVIAVVPYIVDGAAEIVGVAVVVAT